MRPTRPTLRSVRANLFGDLLPVLLAFVLALRAVAAPMMVPMSGDGRIALCLGGQIVQITWQADDPGTPDISRESCPALGITATLEGGPAAVAPAPGRLSRTHHALPPVTTARTTTRAPYLSRAPPRLA